MNLDTETCSRALESADARFDGVFFVGIMTTAIYCRPICPARRTLPKNRRYFTSAAAAERAGFRGRDLAGRVGANGRAVASVAVLCGDALMDEEPSSAMRRRK